MKNFKLFAIILIIATSVFYAMPTANIFFPDILAKYLPGKKVNLGLDLQGGTHLVLSVDTSKLPAGSNADDAVEVVKEIIRNRIDQFGVAEPVIQRQGTNQIIVELPGIKDSARAKQLIGRTAMLEFRLVDEQADLQSAINKNQIPDNLELLSMEHLDENKNITRSQLLIEKEAKLTGKYLKEVQIKFGEFNEPRVTIAFNEEGGKIFSNVTGDNVGRRLAIVLDGVIKSAPVIREMIPSGNAEISGSFTMEEAQDLSIVLRAGSLPAPVKIEQEQTIGPSLGSDSIKSGVMCGILSLAVIWLFILVYYKFSGLIANLALLINVIVLIAAMTMIKATLTLPGIAGIILTIGMSIDANILVFERIREELRQGKSNRKAIENGYHKAFITVLDSNITTIISAVFLYYFGSGSIRGFAVSLTIGLLASMFTAITLSRVLQETYEKSTSKLSI
ncbi:MAG: protein translocase subunit SecD [bacterium]|nr:protein translocase subunit SecD [bacterium]